MTGRRTGVTMAIVFIGAEVTMAASFALTGIAGWHGVANAAPIIACTSVVTPSGDVFLPECDRYDVSAVELPACDYEDGNASGLPCAWTDPDTGTIYHVDSDNYR